MLNKILALIFILIMTIPFIPVGTLSDDDTIRQQMTEEVQENMSNMIEEELKHFSAIIQYNYPGVMSVISEKAVSSYINFDEFLYKSLHFRVLVQPPNYILL